MNDYHPCEQKDGVSVFVPHLVVPTMAIFFFKRNWKVFFCFRQIFSVLRSDEIKMTTLLFMRQRAWEPFTSSIPISKVYIFTCRLCILIFSTDQCFFFFFAALPILLKEKKGFELKVSPSVGLTHKLISNSNWADLTSATQWCDCRQFLLTTINVSLFGTLPICQHGLHPVSPGQ